jgi:hypothetical protein
MSSDYDWTTVMRIEKWKRTSAMHESLRAEMLKANESLRAEVERLKAERDDWKAQALRDPSQLATTTWRDCYQQLAEANQLHMAERDAARAALHDVAERQREACATQPAQECSPTCPYAKDIHAYEHSASCPHATQPASSAGPPTCLCVGPGDVCSCFEQPASSEPSARDMAIAEAVREACSNFAYDNVAVETMRSIDVLDLAAVVRGVGR